MKKLVFALSLLLSVIACSHSDNHSDEAPASNLDPTLTQDWVTEFVAEPSHMTLKFNEIQLLAMSQDPAMNDQEVTVTVFACDYDNENSCAPWYIFKLRAQNTGVYGLVSLTNRSGDDYRSHYSWTGQMDVGVLGIPKVQVSLAGKTGQMVSSPSLIPQVKPSPAPAPVLVPVPPKPAPPAPVTPPPLKHELPWTDFDASTALANLCARPNNVDDKVKCINGTKNKRFDSNALGVCMAEYYTSDKIACAFQIADKRFAVGVPAICNRPTATSDVLQCLATFADHYIDPKHVQVCATEYYTSDKISCLKRVME